MAIPNTPQWLIPSAVGQLSNHRAANTSADRIVGQAKFSSGVAGATPSAIRVVGQRTMVGGIPTPQVNNIWDSSWVGNFATSPFPSIYSGIVLGANSAAVAGGRVYVLVPSTAPYGGQTNVIASVVSAPINGPNIGSWRFETPIQASKADNLGVNNVITDSCNPGAMVHISGFLFVLGQKSIYRAQVNLDGSIGTWNWFTDTGSGLGSTMCGWGRYNFGGVLVVAYMNTVGQPANTIYVNSFSFTSDGNFAGSASLTTIGATGQRPYGALVIDPNSWLYFIGGEDNSGNPQSTVYYKAVNLGTGTEVAATGWVVGQPLPNPRSRFGCAYVNWPSSNWPGSTTTEVAIQVAGGRQTSVGTPTSIVYSTTGTGIRAPAAWGNYSVSMATAAVGCAATMTGASSVIPGGYFPGNFSPTTSLGYENGVDVNAPWSYLAVIGGSNTSNVQTTSNGGGGTGPSGTGTWYQGAGSILTNTILGTGGGVISNADGSVDVTWPVGGKGVFGFGAAMGVTTLLDGDQLQLTVQLADGLSGDVATSLPTVIKVGQPPTLASIAPSGTITNGQPTASFSYNPGAGGGGEYSYRIQVKQGATTLFDTGTRYDNLNSALLTIAPLLTPSTTYTNGLIITAASLDNPIAGASSSVTSTTSFSTSAFTLPGAPSSLVVTPSGANGNMAVSWAAGSSATGYRVYYRRTGSSTWLLYSEPGNVTSTTMMDNIALGVGYDVAVSSLIVATPAESAVMSGTQTGTIPLGSYSAFLHLAGSNTGLPFQVQGTPHVGSHIASATLMGFGQAAPITRYGTGDYRLIAATALLPDSTPATLRTLQAIIDSTRGGSVCFYRDALGGMVTITFDPNQDITIIPPFYRQAEITMTEVPNLVGPYVSSGSAQGYLTLLSGRKPPLSSEESLL